MERKYIEIKLPKDCPQCGSGTGDLADFRYCLVCDYVAQRRYIDPRKTFNKQEYQKGGENE